jgi:hypothetical protein
MSEKELRINKELMPIICIISEVFRLTLMYVQSAGSEAQNV